jgi:subtilisin family serine protease
VLDGVAGHGTFIAGLIANRCANAQLTLVGERRAVIRLPAKRAKVYSDELSVARSLLRYCRADVVSCGFAFPTFGDRASIPFSLIMGWLGQLGQQVAVVAPAGNENSARPYWPAADGRVIGVGATDPSQSLRAEFLMNSEGDVTSGSNWGSWLDCCARGQSVSSLFVDWVGTTEDEQPPKTTLTFTGWASWSGTSFAAPKVTAAIAEAIAGGTLPSDAFAQVLASHAGPPVSTPPIPGSPPVALKNLLLG